MKQNAHIFVFFNLKKNQCEELFFLHLPLLYVTQTTFRFKAIERNKYENENQFDLLVLSLIYR